MFIGVADVFNIYLDWPQPDRHFRAMIGLPALNTHGQVMVLEDDMLTSPFFLTYMNEAFSFYEKEKEVMHITGWSYPISGKGLDDSFCGAENCWGWAI